MTNPSSPVSPPASASARLCLVFVYNHRFESNIEKLEALYGQRFRHIFHLMPFYRGSRENVIPVYGNSFQFQSYFLDAWRALRSENFTHFVFIADDLILHPEIHEGNVLDKLGLGERGGSIAYADPLTTMPFGWMFQYPTLLGFIDKSGAQWEPNLPPPAAAAALIARHGWKADGRLGWKNLRGGLTPRQFALLAFYLATLHHRRKTHPKLGWLDLPYPLLYGGGDFLVLPACAMEEFCHLCGVFAALDVFVEVAAPTALAMACEQVAVQCVRGWHPLSVWPGDALERFNAARGYEIRQLFARFADDCLYVHPIKLSRWKL